MTVIHEPSALSKSMKRGALLLVRSADPTQAGTEARPTNLKLETRNFSKQLLIGLRPTRKL